MAKSNPKNADEGKVKKLETELEAMTVESKNYANEGKEMADADSEYRNLGRDLRMVILTDYIKREQLESEEVPSEISVASIFPS